MKLQTLTVFIAAGLLSVAAHGAGSGDIPEGMSLLVLEAHDVMGDGATGYQWLLDPNHNTYDDVFFPDNDRFFGDYSSFSYSLPEGAEPNGATAVAVVDGEVELLVPAGVYDWMVVRPCSEGLIFPFGEYALVDDFELLPGETYRMKACWLDSYKGKGDYAVLQVSRDVAMEAVVLPANGVGLGQEPVTVRITNIGREEASGVKVAYSVNGADEVVESIGVTLAPGETLDYTFSAKADFSRPGVYDVAARVIFDGDMLPANDSRSASCRNLQPRELPYTCVFSGLGAEGLPKEWIIVDGNIDNSTWMFSEWIENRLGDMGVASCSGSWSGDRIGDDWLISPPLLMKAGDNHVSFSTRSVMGDKPEKVEVCVGTAPDPSAMKVVATYEVCSLDWLTRAATFNVEADGPVYVAFHAVSQNGYNLFISDMEAGEGAFVGKPEVKMERLLVPVSNCDLSAASRVGIRLTNNGAAELADYTLSCTVNGSASVSTTFDTPVKSGETADIYITDTVDLSSVGTYSLEFRLQSADVDMTSAVEVTCFEPITQLPVESNFTQQQNVDIWQQLTPGGWKYEEQFEDFSAQLHGVDKGLLCRGISLAYPARVRLTYAAGGWDSTALGIYFGKAGEDPSTYTKVYENPSVGRDAALAEFTAPIEESGNYSFVIADEGNPESRTFLRLNDISISQMMPCDLRINAVDAPVSAYMPKAQLGHEAECRVEIENRGSNPMTGVSVTMDVDDAEAAVSEKIDEIAPGETVTATVKGMIPARNAGDRFLLSFTVSADEEDGLPADNKYTLPRITVTDDQRSVENNNDLEYGTGGSGDHIALGNVYGFSAPADLTSVSVGLCYTDEANPSAAGDIVLNIFSIDDNGALGRLLYTEKRVRGLGGFMEFDLPDMRLEPGYYYFEIEQLSQYNMGLAYYPADDAVCYNRLDDGNLERVSAGYAFCIRAFFADGAQVYASDAWARAITSPDVDKALFRENETVAMDVRNNGYEAATVNVSLFVDGEVIAAEKVDLLPYEQTNVAFGNVDLSAAGQRSLECVVAADGDANADNDRCGKLITAEEESDPYIMDFESCGDFDAAGDRLNPRWTTIDYNGLATTVFWRYEHPHRGEACGFMAFNPGATQPSMYDEPLKNMLPHAGERMGVAFSFNPYQEGAEGIEESDIWMISPKLTLGDNSSFDFYVRTRDLENLDATLEPYRVLVSLTDTEPESFTVVGEDVRLASVDDWEHVSVDLSDYDNKEVHVAIQYIGKPVVNTCLLIDDLKVSTTSSVSDVVTSDGILMAYDAAAGMLNASSARALSQLTVYSADGMMVKSVKAAGNSLSVDLNGLSAGVYVAAANGECGRKVLKFAVR